MYAANKKSNELMAHVYSHLYGIPTTGLRYFTVYGPWGRPDMSPVLFAHGDRDTNVPVAESVQAHQALQALGARSELLLLSGEVHTIVDREHVVELSSAVVAWFDRWL